jgi:cytochrome c553
MTTRVVLFLFMGTLLGFVAGISSYQHIFSASKGIVYSEKKNEVVAQEVTQDKPIAAVLDLNNPEMKKAQELYTVKGQCITCHGEKGEGNPEKLAPMLSGQHDWYILSQLTAFKNGSRVNEKMQPYLKDLTEADFQILAKYISLLRVSE